MSAWDMIVPSMANDEARNKLIEYASFQLKLDNGLYKEIRFSFNNNFLNYVTEFMHRRMIDSEVIGMADDMLTQRVSFLERILAGYKQAIGKLDFESALAIVNEFLSNRVLAGEFEYQNFSGENGWSLPRQLDEPVSEPFKIITKRRCDLLEESNMPTFDWLFSNKLKSADPCGPVEAAIRACQQRYLLGGPLKQPRGGWRFGNWLGRFGKEKGWRKHVVENKLSKKELVCSFIGMIGRNRYREFRVRYTSEMMMFSSPDLAALMDEVGGLLHCREMMSEHKMFWATLKTAVNIYTVRYLYALFMRGDEAVDSFECENVKDDVTNWNEEHPLDYFFNYFNRTQHFETDIPAPEVETMDQTIVQSGIDFMNKFRQSSTGQSNGNNPQFNSRPLTEEDLYPSQQSNGSDKDSHFNSRPLTEEDLYPSQQLDEADTEQESSELSAADREAQQKAKELVQKLVAYAQKSKTPLVAPTATVESSIVPQTASVESVVSTTVPVVSPAAIVATEEKSLASPVPESIESKVKDTLIAPVEGEKAKQKTTGEKTTLSYAKIVEKSKKPEPEIANSEAEPKNVDVAEPVFKVPELKPKGKGPNSTKNQNQKNNAKKNNQGDRKEVTVKPDTASNNKKKDDKKTSPATQQVKAPVTQPTKTAVAESENKEKVKEAVQTIAHVEPVTADSKTILEKALSGIETVSSSDQHKKITSSVETKTESKKLGDEKLLASEKKTEVTQSTPQTETKTQRKKDKKAAKALMLLKNQTCPASTTTPETSTTMMEKLVMTAKDDTFVEAEFDVKITNSKSKSKKKKKKSAATTSTNGKETTTVTATFTKEMATVFVNNAIIAAQDLFKGPQEPSSSNNGSKDAKQTTENDSDEYVPGQTVTYDYRPGVRSPDSTAESDCELMTTSEGGPTYIKMKTMTESKGCSAGNDDYDSDEIPNDPEGTETVKIANPVTSTLVERACHPQLHEMFRKLKYVADGKNHGGLRNLDPQFRGVIKKRLKRFQLVYAFRARIAKAMLYILDVDQAVDLTGMREKAVTQLVTEYLEDPIDAHTLREKMIDRKIQETTRNDTRECDNIYRGLRFIDLRIAELDKSESLHKSYTAISEKVYSIMEEQEIIMRLIETCANFRDYETYL